MGCGRGWRPCLPLPALTGPGRLPPTQLEAPWHTLPLLLQHVPWGGSWRSTVRQQVWCPELGACSPGMSGGVEQGPRRRFLCHVTPAQLLADVEGPHLPTELRGHAQARRYLGNQPRVPHLRGQGSSVGPMDLVVSVALPIHVASALACCGPACCGPACCDRSLRLVVRLLSAAPSLVCPSTKLLTFPRSSKGLYNC